MKPTPRSHPNPQLSSPGNHRIGLMIVGGVALTSLALTATGDLGASQRFVAPDAGWARFGQRFGELPGVFVGLAAIGVIFSNAEHLARWVRLLFAALTIAFVPLLGLVLGHIAFPRTVGIAFPWQLEEWLFVGVSAFLAAAAATWLWRSNRFEGLRVRLFARVAVLMMLIGNLMIVTPLKYLWGRVRYRDLEPNAEAYTAWLIPNGYTGNFSFPSGHTALAWMVLPLLLLVPRGSRAVRLIVASLLVAWALFVSLSRVRIGAHYISDVAFSTCLQVGLYLWLSRRHAELLLGDHRSAEAPQLASSLRTDG